ncbi:MAG: Hpt domain-containing protein [Caldilineaceae bacterium]
MTSQLSRPIMTVHPSAIIESFVVESQLVTLKESAIEDLAEMISDRDPEILSDLVNTFLGEANRQVQNMVRAMASDNLSLLFLPAHSLKSSSATFGAPRLSQLNEQLEALVTNAPDRTVVSSLVEQIKNENDNVFTAMQNALAQWRP